MSTPESDIKKLVDGILGQYDLESNVNEESLYSLKRQLTTAFEAVDHSLRHQLHTTARGNWIPVSKGLPPLEIPVWLFQDGAIWIGARTMIDSEYWLYGNCYSSFWHNGEEWDCDPETDDDYKPTHWQLLPKPPKI